MYSGDFQRCLENLVRLDLGKNDQLANREGKQGETQEKLCKAISLYILHYTSVGKANTL